MEVYCGDYHANGYKIPYVMEIGWNNVFIKTGDREVKVKANTDEHGDVLWRLNKKSITYQSPNQLVSLFKKDEAYANATFRKFIGE